MRVLWHKIDISLFIDLQFSITEINMKIKTTTVVINNELKYFPVSEGKLEVLPLIWFSKRLVLASFC